MAKNMTGSMKTTKNPLGGCSVADETLSLPVLESMKTTKNPPGDCPTRDDYILVDIQIMVQQQEMLKDGKQMKQLEQEQDGQQIEQERKQLDPNKLISAVSRT
jgi:hypothetical protein